jgi:putative tryptophan/tyrosine transport system substrate-binding protein
MPVMKRREFITLLGGAAAAWPLTARAQQPERIRRIGVLSMNPESDVDWRASSKAFQHRLQELGWTDGRNIQINYRLAAGNVERLSTFAKELAGMAPDLLVATNTPALAARGCPAFLLNIEKRSLPRLMLSGDGLASNDAV